MNAYCQLWDAETMNAIGEFTSLPEALGYVRDEIAAYGEDAVHAWMLLVPDGQQQMKRFAVGAELAREAQNADIVRDGEHTRISHRR